MAQAPPPPPSSLNNKTQAWTRRDLAHEFQRKFCWTIYWRLCLNLKPSSAKFHHFSYIWLGFHAVMYLLEPKGGGGGRSVGLLYCLLLSASYFMIQSQIEWIILLWHISWSRREEEMEGAWDSCTVYYSLISTLWYSHKRSGTSCNQWVRRQ